VIVPSVWLKCHRFPSRDIAVPVTARLSKRFYEVPVEDIANELVDWFNAMDLTYRTDLRELNELNFARFDEQAGAAAG